MKPQYNLTNSEFAESTAPTSIAYGYDQNGNLTSKNVASNQWTYTWDVLGGLLSVANNSGVQGYYAYDGLGRRVEAKEGTSTIFYGYLGTETLAEGAISPYTDYIYPDSLRVTKVTGASGQNPIIVFYHTDALGSIRLVTDAARNVLFSGNYQPFGQDNQSTCSETYKFTGKPFSQTTGLYYEFQRWDDPSVRRFVSQDPLEGHMSFPQSLNGYVYAYDSPTVFTDPSGLSVGYQGSCYDFCGATYSSFEWSAAFLILATSLEIHHFGGAGWLSRQGPGDWICLDCKTVNIDTSTTSSSEPTTVEIDQGLANGRLSNQIGNSREGQFAIEDLAGRERIDPGTIESQRTFDLSTGQRVRPDFYVEGRGIYEVKGGRAYYTDRLVEQAYKLQRLGIEKDVPVTYRLYEGGSLSAVAFLKGLGLPSWKGRV